MNYPAEVQTDYSLEGPDHLLQEAQILGCKWFQPCICSPELENIECRRCRPSDVVPELEVQQTIFSLTVITIELQDQVQSIYTIVPEVQCIHTYRCSTFVKEVQTTLLHPPEEANCPRIENSSPQKANTIKGQCFEIVGLFLFILLPI